MEGSSLVMECPTFGRRSRTLFACMPSHTESSRPVARCQLALGRISDSRQALAEGMSGGVWLLHKEVVAARLCVLCLSNIVKECPNCLSTFYFIFRLTDAMEERNDAICTHWAERMANTQMLKCN